MITLDIKEITKPQYEVVASNGKEINDIIQEILNNTDEDMAELTQQNFSKISNELWGKFGNNIKLLLKSTRPR